MKKIKNIFKIAFVLIFVIACEDSQEVNFDNRDYSYKLRVKFENADSQNRDIFSILNDSINYRIAKETLDTITPYEFRFGNSIQKELIFDDDFFDMGKFNFNFDFKNANGTEIFILDNPRDSTINLFEDRPTFWRIKVKRIKAYHEILIDTIGNISTDFRQINFRYIMPYTDTLKIDSLELLFANSIILDKTFIGLQDIYIESFFKNDSMSYSRDTLILNANFGLVTDTIKTNISELIKK